MKFLLLFLLPFIGNTQCDTVTLFKVEWCSYKRVAIECPDDRPGCLVYHTKQVETCKYKLFVNRNDANELYNSKTYINPDYFVKLKAYRVAVQDILNKTND